MIGKSANPEGVAKDPTTTCMHVQVTELVIGRCVIQVNSNDIVKVVAVYVAVRIVCIVEIKD